MDTDNNLTADFEQCVRGRWKQICGILNRLVGDSMEAEDLALEAFWRLYRHQRSARNSNSSGWLYRVAVNLGLNAIRARNRRERYEEEAGRLAAESATAYDPAKDAERAEVRRLVRLVLSRMKRPSSRLLMLRQAGLSYAELASLLGVSTGSIGTMLARAEREFEDKYRRIKSKGE